jgi:anti-sigma factor RsiW
MMSCTLARASLPELVYGDLAPELSADLEKHLAACPACRQERAALEQVRQQLDLAPPVPTVAVDLPRLYAAANRAKPTRRWVRRTLAGAAVAAVVAFFLLVKLEVRLEGQQLIVRWGAVPETRPRRRPLPRSCPRRLRPRTCA